MLDKGERFAILKGRMLDVIIDRGKATIDLSDLDITDEELQSIFLDPEVQKILPTIQRLYLNKNKLTTLPKGIEKLVALEALDLGHNKLTTLPKVIWSFTTLKMLSLGNNKIETISDEIKNLRALEVLSLGNNKLKKLPKEIGSLPALQELILRYNQLETFSASIEDFPALKGLYLGYNQISTFSVTRPVTRANLVVLEMLDLTNNPIAKDAQNEDARKDLNKRFPGVVEYDLADNRDSPELDPYNILQAENKAGVLAQYTGRGKNKDQVVTDRTGTIVAKNHKRGGPIEDQAVIFQGSEFNHQDFFKKAVEKFKGDRSGSTMTSASLDRNGVLKIATLGDSPVYLVVKNSQGNDIVVQMTMDMDVGSKRYCSMVNALGGTVEFCSGDHRANGSLQCFGALGDKYVGMGLIQKPEYYDYSQPPFRDAIDILLSEKLGIHEPLQSLLSSGEAKIVIASDAFAPPKIDGYSICHYSVSLDLHRDEYQIETRGRDNIDMPLGFIEFYNNPNNKCLPTPSVVKFEKVNSSTVIHHNPIIEIITSPSKAIEAVRTINPKDDTMCVTLDPDRTGLLLDGHGGHQTSHEAAKFAKSYYATMLQAAAAQLTIDGLPSAPQTPVTMPAKVSARPQPAGVPQPRPPANVPAKVSARPQPAGVPQPPVSGILQGELDARPIPIDANGMVLAVPVGVVRPHGLSDLQDQVVGYRQQSRDLWNSHHGYHHQPQTPYVPLPPVPGQYPQQQPQGHNAPWWQTQYGYQPPHGHHQPQTPYVPLPPVQGQYPQQQVQHGHHHSHHGYHRPQTRGNGFWQR